MTDSGSDPGDRDARRGRGAPGDSDLPPPREGGPTEVVETAEGSLVERLSASTATLLLIWLIGIGAGSALLLVWIFALIVLGERLGADDLFSGPGFYIAIFGASGPIVLWLTGRAQGHSLLWYVVTAMKIGALMFAILVGFGALAAILIGPGIGLGAVRSAALLAVGTLILSTLWALATWSADWYIARARVSGPD